MTYTPTRRWDDPTAPPRDLTPWFLIIILIALAVALWVWPDITRSQVVNDPSPIITVTTEPVQGCVSMDAETLTDSEVRALRWAGWYGSPTDGAERLYSPSCGEVTG